MNNIVTKETSFWLGIKKLPCVSMREARIETSLLVVGVIRTIKSPCAVSACARHAYITGSRLFFWMMCNYNIASNVAILSEEISQIGVNPVPKK